MIKVGGVREPHHPHIEEVLELFLFHVVDVHTNWIDFHPNFLEPLQDMLRYALVLKLLGVFFLSSDFLPLLELGLSLRFDLPLLRDLWRVCGRTVRFLFLVVLLVLDFFLDGVVFGLFLFPLVLPVDLDPPFFTSIVVVENLGVVFQSLYLLYIGSQVVL